MNKKRLFCLILACTCVVSMMTGCKHKNSDGEDTEDVPTAETSVTAETTVYNPVIIDAMPEYEYMYTDRGIFDLMSNVIGEISVPAADINYLVVQSDDNEYYLTRNEYEEESKSGAIYGDYRNNFEYLDENNVIYGHNMADGSMFAGLLKLKDESVYVEDEDYFIYFNSKCYNNIFKICSVYEIDLTSFNYIKTGFDDVSKLTFLENMTQRNEVSVLHPEDTPEKAKLITLSTCTSGGSKRLVVQGYLLSRSAY